MAVPKEMITINCRTNLDLNCEEWPEELPAVGDRIRSKTKWAAYMWNSLFAA